MPAVELSHASVPRGDASPRLLAGDLSELERSFYQEFTEPSDFAHFFPPLHQLAPGIIHPPVL